jgi:hypothetical protein
MLPFPVPVGTPLGGYAARTGSAAGALDELTVGALVLDRAGEQFVVAAADVIAVDAALVDEVAVSSGLDRAELALCASHTHSGPAGVVARLHPADPDRLEPGLRSRFLEIVVGAIETARSRLQAVDLLYGRAPAVGVAANRNDVSGPSDGTLSVLATRRGDGSLQAVVVHFACHPTILGADNRRLSADFPGALRRALAADLAGDERAPVVLFVNGAAGDVSTRFTRHAQDAGEVKRVGTALATAATTALAQARPLEGAIRHDHATVPLPPRPRNADGDIARIESISTANPAAAKADGQRRILETKAQGAAMLAALSALPDAALPAEVRLDGWLLGDLALLTVPGELFASLGRVIGFPESTLVLGYANGYVGYLADRAAYAAATYEALASPFASGAGERVASEAAALLARLRSERHAS